MLLPRQLSKFFKVTERPLRPKTGIQPCVPKDGHRAHFLPGLKMGSALAKQEKASYICTRSARGALLEKPARKTQQINLEVTKTCFIFALALKAERQIVGARVF